MTTKTLLDWSIELGFNGKINKELEEKIKSVKVVRTKLLKHLFLFLSTFTIFFLMLIINQISPFMQSWQQIPVLILFILTGWLFYKNIKIWIEIYAIKKERYVKYNKRR